jgi:hypothetical protein
MLKKLNRYPIIVASKQLLVVPNIPNTTNLYNLMPFLLQWYCFFQLEATDLIFLNGQPRNAVHLTSCVHYTLLQLPLEETTPQYNTSMGPCINNLQTVASTPAQSTAATYQSRSSALQTLQHHCYQQMHLIPKFTTAQFKIQICDDVNSHWNSNVFKFIYLWSNLYMIPL